MWRLFSSKLTAKSRAGRFDVIARQMAEKENVTEKLKAADQMSWVRKMNNIRARADEIVKDEIIYIL